MSDFKPDKNLEIEEFKAITESKPKRVTMPMLRRVIVVLVIIILLVLGGRWLHHVFSKSDTPKAPVAPTTSQTQRPTATTTPQTTTPTQATSSAGVPNTGPGDVLALFVGTVVVATALHRVVLSKKSA